MPPSDIESVRRTQAAQPAEAVPTPPAASPDELAQRVWPPTNLGKLFDLVILFLGAVPAAALIRFAPADTHALKWAGFLLGLYVAWSLSTMAVLVGLRLVLAKVPPAGRYPAGSKEVTGYGLYLLLCTFVYRSFLRSWMCCFTFPGYYFYKLMGCRIAAPPIIGVDAKLLDPGVISIGRNVVLGENSVLCGHFVQGRILVIDPIVIGDNVTVGANAFISPGVHIGDGAIVAAGAVVATGTRIEAGTRWGGVPARRL